MKFNYYKDSLDSLFRIPEDKEGYADRFDQTDKKWVKSLVKLYAKMDPSKHGLEQIKENSLPEEVVNARSIGYLW